MDPNPESIEMIPVGGPNTFCQITYRNQTLNRTHIYGIANLYYEFLEGTRVDVSGTSFASRNDRVWGGLGVGGTYNWDDDKYSIYGEGLVNTSLNNFGESYSVKGQFGFRMK